MDYTNAKLSSVPVVLVFTKLDELEDQARNKINNKNSDAEPHVRDLLVNQEIERVLRCDYIEPIRQLTGKENFPHVKVSGKNFPRA